jgi:hypothetical protein
MTPITSRHVPDRVSTLVVTLALAGLFAVVPFSIWHAAGDPGAGVMPIAIGVLCLAGAVLAMRTIVRRDAEALAWTLTDDSLAGGVGHCRIPLADIVEVSAGVPVAPGRPATVWHQRGLVLKLRGGRLLALNLLQAEHGPTLMEALAARCASVFTASPTHTQHDLALLHRLQWNRIVGADERG